MTNAVLNLPNQPVNFSLVPVDQLESLFRSIVREEIRNKNEDELKEKFLSPAEVCDLFKPKISIATLNNWSNQGLVQKHHIGKLTFYKYSEILSSIKTLKKYQRQPFYTTANA